MVKRLLFFIILSLIIFNPSHAKWGKGNLKLSQYTMEGLIMYMYGAGNTKYSGAANQKNDPLIIAISDDGKNSYYFYCPAQYRAYGCMSENTARKAIVACEKQSVGSPCFIFAVKRRVVWKNGGKKLKIKTKDLKSPYVVAKKIQDSGFYDGDISKLAGISVETGQIDDSIKITGKDKKKNKTTSSSKQKNLVKELNTLSKLYKSGALSKKEFEEAKKKLLSN